MAYLGYALLVVIWGTSWYFVNEQVQGVPSTWAVAYRFALATVFLWIILLITREKPTFEPKKHLFLVGIGAFMFSINYILVYLATEDLTSGLVALAFSCMTFWNIINARIFLKIPLEGQVGVAALLGLFGLSLMFSSEIEGLSFGDGIAVAIGVAFCAGFVASLGNTIAASKTLSKASPIAINAWGMAYGSLINIAIAFGFDGMPVIRTDLPYLGTMFYLSIVGTVISFTLYLWLLRTMGLARPAYIVVMAPLVAITVSSFLEGYVWSTASITGLVLVLAGNVLIIQSRTSNRAQKPAEPVSETA